MFEEPFCHKVVSVSLAARGIVIIEVLPLVSNEFTTLVDYG